jgi:predicted 3-demethylubiquinone-9 3-methyltransferase (glyoxalase superfamily)
MKAAVRWGIILSATDRDEADMLSITPFLWFDTQAEEAMQFYTSIFPRSKVIAVHRNGDQIMSVTWELEGQRFMGLNAGPHFAFNEAVSFFVSCETQQEVDELWDKLLAGGGKPTQCGWLKDRFGLSWQIIPDALPKLLADPDRAKAGRAMQAMMGMVKIDAAGLQRAFDGA